MPERNLSQSHSDPEHSATQPDDVIAGAAGEAPSTQATGEETESFRDVLAEFEKSHARKEEDRGKQLEGTVVSVTADQANALARDHALAEVPVVWLVTRQAGIFDPDNDMPKALADVRRPGPVQQWSYVAVQPFYRR